MAVAPDARREGRAAAAREKPVYDLSVRTFDEAAMVSGVHRTGVTASGAGGGGASTSPSQRRPRDGRASGKTLTTQDVPLSDTPIKRAAMTHVCLLCGLEVVQGDEIWPVLKPEGVSVNPGGRKAAAHAWAHLECARANAAGGELSAPVCPHWLKRGSCAFGVLCFYQHPEGLAAEQAWQENERTKQQPKRSGTWKRRVTRKSGKAPVFRRWLIDTFGLELLSSGSGVLDVAGGKGEVAFELVNLNRVPTTVVDPRPIDLSSYKRKFEFGIYWRNPLMHVYIHPEVSCDTSIAAPRHLRVFFDDCYLNAFEQAAGSDGNKEWEKTFSRAVEQGHQVVWTKKGLIPCDDLTPENSYPCRKRGSKELRIAGTPQHEGLIVDSEPTRREEQTEAEAMTGSKTIDTLPGQENLPPGYLCKLCKVPGHWKKDCPIAQNARRERMSGVPAELRASRQVRIDDQEGLDWAGCLFDSLDPLDIGSTEQDSAGAREEEEVGPEDKVQAGLTDRQAGDLLMTCTDGEEILEAAKALSVLKTCSVVIGLHPDQAVGSLVDFALAHNKPFACVPCCVYWKSFPRRKLADGSQVRTYDQLIQWLKAKHPEIQETTIDFEGKNRLLWWRPSPPTEPPVTLPQGL